MAEFTDHVGGPIAWRESGSDIDGQPPLIFLHGLGGTRSAWGPQLRGLGQRFRCIAWDMPGYGDSDAIEPLTFATTADAVASLLDRLDIDKANLIGLSFGGMHALHTAIRHPDRVDRMVLSDTSPAFGLDGTTVDGWVRSRLDPIDRGQAPGDMAEAVVDAITANPLRGQIRQEIVGAFGQISADGFRAAVHCLPTNDVRESLASIPHPTQVIVGELDAETPVAYADLLADGLPSSELHVLDGVGHLAPSEAPDRFNHLVEEFLNRSPIRTDDNNQ